MLALEHIRIWLGGLNYRTNYYLDTLLRALNAAVLITALFNDEQALILNSPHHRPLLLC